MIKLYRCELTGNKYKTGGIYGDNVLTLFPFGWCRSTLYKNIGELLKEDNITFMGVIQDEQDRAKVAITH